MNTGQTYNLSPLNFYTIKPSQIEFNEKTQEKKSPDRNEHSVSIACSTMTEVNYEEFLTNLAQGKLPFSPLQIKALETNEKVADYSARWLGWRGYLCIAAGSLASAAAPFTVQVQDVYVRNGITMAWTALTCFALGHMGMKFTGTNVVKSAITGDNSQNAINLFIQDFEACGDKLLNMRYVEKDKNQIAKWLAQNVHKNLETIRNNIKERLIRNIERTTKHETPEEISLALNHEMIDRIVNRLARVAIHISNTHDDKILEGDPILCQRVKILQRLPSQTP